MRKMIALLLALVMVLSLCACAETETPEATGGSTAATVPTTPSDPTNPSDPSDPVDEGNFYVVSQIKNHIIDEEDFYVVIDLTYDEDYNIVGFKVYENDLITAAYTFDKSIEKPLTALDYGKNGVVESREEFTYDDHGNLLTGRTYFGDEMMTEAIYTYDDQGNVLTKYYDNGEEDWTETYVNTYENGVLTEVKIYTGDVLDQMIRYDADGNEILNIYYYFGEEGTRDESVYENGKLIQTVEYADGLETSREEYTYNSNGDMLTRIVKYEGVESHRQENTYNEAGQLIEIKYFNGDSYSANTVYTYAADGSPESVKAYDEGELELESTFTSKKTTVSEEQIQILTDLYAMLIEDFT